ncbi:hypothetical protein [Cystobacter fuscus]|uniref:hypothetical protein n=1 Tax=Cystobacter fuscus TaxID=43 RepID=UPI002B2BAA39|nr:hypothetical protein F0U63_35625 [Cystobacter fuscus]
MNEIFSSLEAVFLKPSFGRLLFFLFIIFAAMLGFYLFESMSGHVFLNSTERKIALLKELQELKKDGISSNPELLPAYDSLVASVTEHKLVPISAYAPDWPKTFDGALSWAGIIGRSLAGTPLGILLLLIGAIEYRRGKEKQAWTVPIYAGVWFFFLGSALSLWLPEEIPWYLRCLICFIILILAFAGIAMYGAFIKKRPAQSNKQV